MKKQYLILIVLIIPLFFTSCKKKGYVNVNEIYGTVQNCMAPFIVQFYCDINHQPSEVRYTWDFGDKQISNDKDPEHVYQEPGIYNVRLIIENYETIHEEDFVININSDTLDIISNFEYNIAYNMWAPVTVEFFNYSQFATSYFWNFGDGIGSSEYEPTHIFETADTFNVQLHAICAGDTATYSIPFEVRAAPEDIIIEEVVVWLPDDYGGYTYELEYYYDIHNETPLGLGGITASSFPITWIINEDLFFFGGDFDNDFLTFEIWDVANNRDPVYTFSLQLYELQDDHYPDIITWDEGNGFAAEVVLKYQ